MFTSAGQWYLGTIISLCLSPFLRLPDCLISDMIVFMFSMNTRVVEVQPNPDFTLTLTFANGELRRFDVKPYLNSGIFRDLRELRLFNAVRPLLGSIQWSGGQDFCPDTLYQESVLVSESKAEVALAA